MPTKRKSTRTPPVLAKAPTGIRGLDEVLTGGLPRGRPTLACGGPGCGKTLLAIEFLVRGAVEFGEPGVFVTFEETAEELAQNVASLGFDLDRLVAEGLLSIDYVHVARSEIAETGEYDLEALFLRLGYALDSIGARRIALDTLETLFGGLSSDAILRAELRRLFRWLKDRGTTAIVTAERGDGTLTRHGLEEYVSDCVILLDHRVEALVSTRRLRIVKYRGTRHGANEFPFLIGDTGLHVLPITSARLDHPVSDERISTGVARLDAMLGGEGFYRGSNVLITGSAGTGKTSLATHAADASCRRGERCLYFAFEESRDQILRNMRSIGLDLGRWVAKGLLQFHNVRPTLHGLEEHLTSMHRLIEEHQPRMVVLDPISNFILSGSLRDSQAMLLRLIDHLKSLGITAVFTNLTHDVDALEATDLGVSSIIDTWLLVRDIESNGERNRGLYVLKSRGMAHSNQIREFRITSDGIELIDVGVGPQGPLTGSARKAQEARARVADRARELEIEKRRRDLERRGREIESKIEALRREYEAECEEVEILLGEATSREEALEADQQELAASRKAGAVGNGRTRRGKKA